MSTFIPLSGFRSYLDGEQLLPKRFETVNSEEFLDFLLDGRCQGDLLSSCMSLVDYLRCLRKFGPTELYLYGEIVEKPYQVVRGRIYVRLAGGFARARKASEDMRRGEPGVFFRTKTPAELADDAKRMLTAHSRLIAEHADQESGLDHFILKRILPLPLTHPVIRLSDPNWEHLQNALRNYCA